MRVRETQSYLSCVEQQSIDLCQDLELLLLDTRDLPSGFDLNQ